MNKRLFIFPILILGIILWSMNHKKTQKRKKIIEKQSESAKMLYKGKIAPVYNPLDASFILSDDLKNKIHKEKEMNHPNLKNWRIISIWASDDDLYDEGRGIIANPEKRSQLWERASYIYYYINGELKFERFAGLRVHGGASRRGKDKSLRLYFRKKYDQKYFYPSPEISFNEKGKISRLVLRRELPLAFSTQLSFSFVNELGGIAPKLKPALVYLNGEFFGIRLMMEHLNKNQFRYSLNKDVDKFLYYKLKGDNNPTAHKLYENTIKRIKYMPSPIDINEVKKLVDLDSITANILTIMYLGITDWAQGVYFKENRDIFFPWKLISFDFDQSFRIENQRLSISLLLKNHTASLRSILFKRLIFESEEYRSFFKSKLNQLVRASKSNLITNHFQVYKSQIEEFPYNKKELNYSIETINHFMKNRIEKLCFDSSKILNIQCEK